jgi:hypothetical protein
LHLHLFNKNNQYSSTEWLPVPAYYNISLPPDSVLLCTLTQILNMKRVLLLVVMCMPALFSYAQKNKKDKKAEEPLPPPRVWIANLPSYNTTYELITANNPLITDSVGCKVSLFSISLSAPGQPFYGPMHCVGNIMNESQRAAIERWKDIKDITLHIQDIHLNCHETDATSPALTYMYNEQK